jgi:hypothetical protein
MKPWKKPAFQKAEHFENSSIRCRPRWSRDTHARQPEAERNQSEAEAEAEADPAEGQSQNWAADVYQVDYT